MEPRPVPRVVTMMAHEVCLPLSLRVVTTLLRVVLRRLDMTSVDIVAGGMTSRRRRRVVMRVNTLRLVRLVLRLVVLLVRLLSMKLVCIPLLFIHVSAGRWWVGGSVANDGIDIDSDDSSDHEEELQEARRDAYEDGREDQAEYDEEYD